MAPHAPPSPHIREAEASMLKIARVEKGARAVGGRYALCRLMGQRARQIARRFSREDRDLHRAIQLALDETVRGALNYEGPWARAPLNAVKYEDCAELPASGRSMPDRQRSF
jgi:DNA-directed RNA polymerase subunit K/omega